MFLFLHQLQPGLPFLHLLEKALILIRRRTLKTDITIFGQYRQKRLTLRFDLVWMILFRCFELLYIGNNVGNTVMMLHHFLMVAPTLIS